MKKIAHVDTNVLMRYLVHNDKKQTLAARKLLEDDSVQLVLLDTALAEVVWALSSFYKIDRVVISSQLRLLLASLPFRGNIRLLDSALELFGRYSVDYIDAYQAAVALQEGLPIYSWDKDFDKIPGIIRIQP